jgi:hypothetical protein
MGILKKSPSGVLVARIPHNGGALRDDAPMYFSSSSLPAALAMERRVLAQLGWEGQTARLFEHSRLLGMFSRVCQT